MCLLLKNVVLTKIKILVINGFSQNYFIPKETMSSYYESYKETMSFNYKSINRVDHLSKLCDSRRNYVIIENNINKNYNIHKSEAQEIRRILTKIE